MNCFWVVCFSIESLRELNRILSWKTLVSWVELIQFLGKPFEPWVESIQNLARWVDLNRIKLSSTQVWTSGNFFTAIGNHLFHCIKMTEDIIILWSIYAPCCCNLLELLAFAVAFGNQKLFERYDVLPDSYWRYNIRRIHVYTNIYVC